jgi:crooked neck
LVAARSVLGHAIGLSGKEKIYQAYIQLELQLGNVSRCRTLYGSYLERYTSNCKTWVKFAELETHLGEVERARHIFELAIAQPLLDMPEVLWKAYIDFEIDQGQREKTIALYRRLLDRTKHVKVWISFAQYEYSIDRIDEARRIYEEAYNFLKANDQKEERVLLVQSWKQFEEEVKDEKGLARVNSLLPKRIRKKRQIKAEDGSNAGWEEYYDYVFPDEQAAIPNLKILQRAHQWKTQAT